MGAINTTSMMSRVILALTFAARAFSLPTNDDTWEEVSTEAGPDFVILDAGSGGTKIFSYVDGDTWDNANIDSKCIEPNHGLTNKGLAVLNYKPGAASATTCSEQFQLWSPRDDIGTGGKYNGKDILKGMVTDLTTGAHPAYPHTGENPIKWTCPQETCTSGDEAGCMDKYRNFLVRGVESYYKQVHPGETAKAKNSAAIPIVATAGMRMLDQDENNKIWGGICGTKDNTPPGTTYNIAEKGKSCGTISGTTEALYEYKGYVAKQTAHASFKGATYKADRGTFTIGGASAQIAFPLKTKAQEAKFKELMVDAAQNIRCDHMKLVSGKLAPKFEENGWDRLQKLVTKAKLTGLTKETSGCVTDYVDIKEDKGGNIGTISFLNLAANQPATAYKCDAKLKEVLHTCLHAKMQPEDKKAASCRAAKAQCSAPLAGGGQEMANWAEKECDGINYADCTKKLSDALQQDGFWGAVTDWFKSTTLGVNHFAYATENANRKIITKDDPPGTPGTPGKGAGELEAKPGEECKEMTGAKKFDWKTKDGKKAATECVKAIWAKMYLTSFFGTGSHPNTEAEMGPNTDWANGFPLSLLEVDTDDVKFHYTDGLFAELVENAKL